MRYEGEARTGDTQVPGTSSEQGIKEQAAQRAQDLMHQAEDQVRSRLDNVKRDAARSLSTVASSLRQSSAQLRSETPGPTSEYVERAADQVERLANYVERTEVSEMIGRAERFAHRRPEIVIGGAFLVGVLGARFLKSSRRNLSESSGYAAGRQGFSDREVPTSVSLESRPLASDDPWGGTSRP